MAIMLKSRWRWLAWWQAYRLWLKADCVDLSAAFAYHTLQSFFPALLSALSLVSRELGRDRELLASLLQLVALVLPEAAMPMFEATLPRFTSQGVGAGVLGLILLLLTACNIYLTLQRGADRLWWNRPWGQVALPWPRLIRRFVLLEKELDHDDGEVTATMKVRRSSIYKTYAREIEALFKGKE